MTTEPTKADNTSTSFNVPFAIIIGVNLALLANAAMALQAGVN